jgi:hypothetical protein
MSRPIGRKIYKVAENRAYTHNLQKYFVNSKLVLMTQNLLIYFNIKGTDKKKNQ